MKWSAGFRFFVVGLLALLMYIPLFFVGSIIDSRVSYSRSTIMDVSREWGGAQTISGPQLIIPVEGPVTRIDTREITDPITRKVTTEAYEVTEIKRKAPIHILPNRFDVRLDTTSEERRRGIFRVPVYTAQMEIDFDYDLSGGEFGLRDGETPLWDEAYLKISVTSNRALRGETELTVGDRALLLEPVAGADHRKGGIVAELGDPRDLGTFNLALGFNGAQNLFIAPVGRTTDIQMASDWPHPSFTGSFLPNSSEIGEEGFTATWTIPHLARALPQIARSDFDDQARQTSLGVTFFQPNDFYQRAYRAARYGILFIALTFLTVLLIDRTSERPTHPVQYILIGLAQSVFVLLMVAYAEQIGFGAAYALASSATVGLLVMFGFTGLRLGRRTWVLGAMLVIVYAVLYLILRSADYALLAGATLSFLALAATMFATRNEQWYGPAKAPGERRGWFSRPPAPPADPSPSPAG